jgi:Ca2+-dependent lipid-binding protein
VNIKNAKDLKSSWYDKIDPYVLVIYGGKEFKTNVKDNNENPEFN